MRELIGKYKGLLICISIAAVTLAAYWRVLDADFINFDDTLYVTENPHVNTGLSIDNIKWAFSVGKVGYWHPLTWLSHMVDCRLYGLEPGPHHLTNLLLHIANSLLLFVVLRRMTGAVWCSAFVAAVFAVHPLNVDSVAWVAERKNVLSTMFWLLTIWAYVGYAESGRTGRYLLAVVFFVMGLLAKPMLVTLPMVMLLLDYWPLRRLSFRQPSIPAVGKKRKPLAPPRRKLSVLRLIWEKSPFLVLSLISVVLSFLSVRRLGITTSTDLVPLTLRLSNAAVSYVTYITKIICPRNLAVFYPYPMEVAVWKSVGALLLLAGVSFLLVWTFRKKAYPAIGWLWFVGSLLPVIGLVQAGLWPATADRWAYVPMIGLSVAVAWAVGDLAAKRRIPAFVFVLAAGACLTALTFSTFFQVGCWRNSKTLFTHALNVTTGNYIAHVNLGNALIKDGETAQAMSHYEKAIKIHPAYADAHYNLGVAFALEGDYGRAAGEYDKTLKLKPTHFKARLRLAEALTRIGRIDEAVAQYDKLIQTKPDNIEVLNNFVPALLQKKQLARAVEVCHRALRIAPDSVEVLNNLANTLVEQGRFESALANLKKALTLEPNFVKTYYNLAGALTRAGRLDEAVDYYDQALQLDPNDKIGHNALAQILARQKKYDQARRHYEAAIRLDPNFAKARYNLGLLFAELGQIDEAITQFREVLRIYPNDAEMHCNVGTLLARQSRLDEAIGELREALRLDPSLSRARVQLDAALAKKAASTTP
ncbi:MAG: tetratricopeptide repeat protein [Sedimentisphaerales bacterium]|nr:tetratricopeptide repeat protein [Sedimentisphaerales bacterium]